MKLTNEEVAAVQTVESKQNGNSIHENGDILSETIDKPPEKMSPKDDGQENIDGNIEMAEITEIAEEEPVESQDSNDLLLVKNGSLNGKDCSFSSDILMDDNLSEVSEESMNLQLSGPEDDDDKLLENDTANDVASPPILDEAEINSETDEPEETTKSETTETNTETETELIINKTEIKMSEEDKTDKTTDLDEKDTASTDLNPKKDDDDDENSSETDVLSLLEPICETNVETDIEKETDEAEIENEPVYDDIDEDLDRTDVYEKTNDTDIDKTDDIEIDKSDDFEIDRKSEHIESNDMNIDDIKHESDLSEDKDMSLDENEFESSSSLKHRLKKKRKLLKMVRNKEIKITKSLVEKWKAVKERSENDNTTNTTDIDIDEVPLLLRSASSETLDEIANVCDEDSQTETEEKMNDLKNVPENVEEIKIKEDSTIDLSGEKDIKEEKLEEELNIPKKRCLERTTDELEIETKKPKIDIKPLSEKKDYLTLEHFQDFMKTKINGLSRKHLEEFCLQKMFEILAQNSELGELRHQIKLQEQMLDTWRNKATSLSKQCRDLEIVKSRLIQDMKNREKEGQRVTDAIPVKITRSVGLQVCLPTPNLFPRGRLPSTGPSQTTPTQHPTVPVPVPVQRKSRVSLPAKLPNNPVPPMPPINRVNNPQIINTAPIQNKPIPVKTIKTILPQKDSSLLSKVLQSPVAAQKKPNPTPPTTPRAASASVIDLTDEDEHANASAMTTVVNTNDPMPSGGGVRVVNQSQLVNTATSSAPVVATSMAGPRLTYLVTSGGQQPQPVMLHTLATSTAQMRPGVRNIMFKPLTQTAGPRMNAIRVPSSVVVNQNIRPPHPIRINNIQALTRQPAPPRPQILKHPAPLPGPPILQPSQPNWKAMPPRPALKISRVGDGIVLSWKILTKNLSLYEEIASYQLYAYQETNAPPSTDMWRKVGDVKALALPMACTLTQFTEGNKYHFAVRAVDVKSRVGPFSQPEKIKLS